MIGVQLEHHLVPWPHSNRDRAQMARPLPIQINALDRCKPGHLLDLECQRAMTFGGFWLLPVQLNGNINLATRRHRQPFRGLGLKIKYAEQEEPNGLAESFIIGRKFVGSDSVALILGDNIFFGQGISGLLKNAREQSVGASVFAYWVADPRPYGIAVLDEDKNVISLEEKPKEPQSNWAVTGLYFYDNQVLDIAANLEKSKRGELEITDINNTYLARGELQVKFMGRGYAWLDTGTHEALLQASQFVETIEARQGFKIACIEEVALRMEFISVAKFKKMSKQMDPSTYSEYLKRIVSEFEPKIKKRKLN